MVSARSGEGMDAAFSKRIAFSEWHRLELRTEVFKLTDTAPPGAPDAMLDTTGFDRINSAGDPRVFQLAAKFLF